MLKFTLTVKCVAYRKTNVYFQQFLTDEFPPPSQQGSCFADCAMVCCPHLSPNILTDKMASENSPETQDEKTALIEKDPEQDVTQEGGTVAKQSESKLTLYHWTQSFNSQKVSLYVSAPRLSGQLLITGLNRYRITHLSAVIMRVWKVVDIQTQWTLP